jgi:tetratricopeptide (TPR) repeat protein
MLSRVTLIALFAALYLLPADASAVGLDEEYTKPTNRISWSDTFKSFYKNDAFSKSYALIIGVGDYNHYSKLSAPAHDAIRIRDFLRDEAGFDRIITLTDDKATRSRIESLMESELPLLVGPKDRFLFYFSGHGDTRTFSGDEKRGYLVLKSSGSKSWHEMIDMPRVRQWAQNLGHTRHTLLLLDACFSGLAALQRKSDHRDMTISRLTQPGHHIVTAGVEGEESYAVDERSLFTSAFLSAARDGDYTGDGIISLSEMMTRINTALDAKRAELGDRIRMTPQQWYTRTDNNPGEFFFLKQVPNDTLINTPNIRPLTEIESKGSSTPETNAKAKDVFERGEAYRLAKEYDRAIAEYNEAIRLNPVNAEVWGSRGQAYLLKEQYDRAIIDLSEAISLDPKYAWIWAERGEAYRLKEEYDRAVADFNEAIRLDSKSAFAWGHRGQVYLSKRDYDRAIADLSEAIRLDPRSGWKLAERGEGYRLKGEYDRAIADLSEAIRLNPVDDWAWAHRGRVYLDKREYDRAIADLSEAVRLNPNNNWTRSIREEAYRSKHISAR